MTAPQPDAAMLAIIIPTLNESGNIAAMVAAIDAALVGRRYEIMFVDDWSTDGTPDAVAAIAQARHDVRLLRRHDRRGLSSAVVEGVLATTAPVIAVIDADMQHDETLLPRARRRCRACSSPHGACGSDRAVRRDAGASATRR